jgi:hypothetical protein
VLFLFDDLLTYPRSPRGNYLSMFHIVASSVLVPRISVRPSHGENLSELFFDIPKNIESIRLGWHTTRVDWLGCVSLLLFKGRCIILFCEARRQAGLSIHGMAPISMQSCKELEEAFPKGPQNIGNTCWRRADSGSYAWLSSRDQNVLP